MSGIEARSIDWVPLRERHGTVAAQGRFWFVGNCNFLTIAIGFIGPGMGLGMGWTILAIVAGILAGTVFQAAHASQGAEMGLPQMIQSRAQFGYRGVIVPLFAALFTYVSFNVLNTIVLAEGMAALAGWNRVAVAIVVNLAGGALALWGHDWLHRAFGWLFWLGLPLLVALSLAILLGVGAPGVPHAAGGFAGVAFMTQLTAAASFNLSYATYVSDYTRYLPPDTSARRVMGAVFLGAAASAIWLMALGAWLAVRLGGEDALADLTRAGDLVVPGLGVALAAVSVAGLAAAVGMNAYSGMLTLVTALDCVRAVRPTRRLRAACVGALTLLCTFVAVRWGGHMIAALNAAVVVMLYLLAPWTAINLADYFLVRHGRYSVADLFTPAGIYGAWGWRGLGAYGAGFAASLPFFAVPEIFVGPAARAMGGVDVGWVVSLGISAGCYLMLRPDRTEAAVPLDGEAAWEHP
jgi:purine-cytosine permease-like protein